LADTSDVPEQKLAEPVEVLEGAVPSELVELGLRTAREYCSTPARGLALVTPPGTGTGAGRGVAAKEVLWVSIAPDGLVALDDDAVRLSDGQRRAIETLAAAPDEGLPAAELAGRTGFSLASARRLAARGFVFVESRRQRRAPVHAAVGALTEGVTLTADQAGALSSIRAAMDVREYAELLLHGVTGSGKTEVYLGAAGTAIEAGRGVIVMVPEIALTPQVVTRFTARFGERVAVLHSKLTPGQRRDEWTRLRAGEADICVGPRSAVFAPVRDLGMIVVDEEHDASYKQESDPRYDAREVAAWRAQAAQAVLVAGSATPRPESWRRMRHLKLPRRVDGSPPPPVELVDMTGERRALHPVTGAALAKVAGEGEKAIVLLNRRGWSNFITCRECGHVWNCPNCDVTLVLHKARGEISCHHCGHRRPLPETCDECGSSSVARFGAGTERLEAELRTVLGGRQGFEIVRLDADTAAREGVGALLSRFDAARSGVLIGTQMVAKGHDFPDVTLAVVIDADATLRFPDFRAEERTFALVAQLAGRSGRGERGGRVLVQTTSPRARALTHAARHDAEGFLVDELTRREAFGYPPFAHLARLVCASPERAAAHNAADLIAGRLREAEGQVLGPVPLFRLKGNERFQIEVKSSSREQAAAAVREALDVAVATPAARGVRFTVDIDPQ
jgi:primosomal protein N' (replication factor Y)